MMMPGKAFVDTNIFLRAMMVGMPLHHECETLVFQQWSNDIELWISRQVIREYLVQATHPQTFNPPLSIQAVSDQLAKTTPLFRVADDTDAVTKQLISLLNTYPTRGKQVHDANIVATMKNIRSR